MASAIKMINALMTSKNKPSVKTVKGIVKTTKIGLTTKFNSAITSAMMMAAKNPSTPTPGNK